MITPNEVYEFAKKRSCPICKAPFENGVDIRTYEFDDHYLSDILCATGLDYMMELEYADPKKLYVIAEQVDIYAGDKDVIWRDEEITNEYHIKFYYCPDIDVPIRSYDKQQTKIRWFNLEYPYEEEYVVFDGKLFDIEELTKQDILNKIRTCMLFR